MVLNFGCNPFHLETNFHLDLAAKNTGQLFLFSHNFIITLCFWIHLLDVLWLKQTPAWCTTPQMKVLIEHSPNLSSIDIWVKTSRAISFRRSLYPCSILTQCCLKLSFKSKRLQNYKKKLCKNFVRHEHHFRWTTILFSINIASPKQHQKKLIEL